MFSWALQCIVTCLVNDTETRQHLAVVLAQVAAQKASDIRTPAPSPQKASNEVKPSAPSGTRVIDQIAELRKAQGKQDGAFAQQPSLRAAAMRGSFNRQRWDVRTVDLFGPTVKQQLLMDEEKLGYQGCNMEMPLYQAPESRAQTTPSRAPPPPAIRKVGDARSLTPAVKSIELLLCVESVLHEHALYAA